MAIKGFFIVTTLLFVSAMFPNSAEAEEAFTVAHGVTVIAHAKEAYKRYQESTHEKLKILNSEGMGADSILIAVDRGQAELGISGNPWSSTLEVANKRKLGIKNLEKINHEVLGKDPFFVVTYVGGPTELSHDQIKSLFTGKVKNWKEIGGENLPVLVVTVASTPGAQQTFSKLALDGEPMILNGSKTVYRPEELGDFVAKTKGAIAFTTPGLEIGKVNRPKHERIEREITAITLGSPSARAKKLMAEFSKLLNAH